MGTGDLLGTLDPSGHGFRYKIVPVMGNGFMGFLTSRFFIHEYGFGMAKPSGFVVAI